MSPHLTWPTFVIPLLAFLISVPPSWAQVTTSTDLLKLIEARSLNQQAIAAYDAGRYDEALPLLQRALAIHESTLGPEHSSTTTSLNNLAEVLEAQGRYGEAEPLYRRALTIRESIIREGDLGEYYPESISTLNRFALASMGNERNDLALAATSLNQLANLLHVQGRHNEAEPLHRSALAINELVLGENHPTTATSLNSLALVLHAQARYDEAEFLYRRALAIHNPDSPDHAHSPTANTLNNLAMLLRDQGRYAEAAPLFEQAVSIYESVRGQIDHTVRRHYLATRLSAYQNLISTRLRLGEPEHALAFVEQSTARLLAEKVTAGNYSRKIHSDMFRALYQDMDRAAETGDTLVISASEARLINDIRMQGSIKTGQTLISALQEGLSETEALIVYANAGAGTGLAVFVLTREGLVALEVPDSAFNADAFATYRDQLVGLSRQMRVRRQRQRAAAGLAPEAARGLYVFEAIVQFYRRLLVEDRQPADTTTDNATAREDLARRFYDLLIAPVEAHLTGKTELIIVPSGPLGFLPFETLVGPDGQYLAETHHVRYAPSATVLYNLRDRDHIGTDRAPLLAFGGALYESGSSVSRSAAANDTTRYANAAQVEAAQRRAYADLSLGGDLDGNGFDGTYDALGYGRWSDLPGSRSEVNGLAATVPGAEVVTGPKVSEAEVKRRSEAGELAQYRLLHFATHGLVVPEVPELSALVLSQDSTRNAADGEDGYLRMNEIAQLNLSADVVTLSACETGLGQLVRGEGVVGLTQAFIEAGAGGVSTSLWQVNDQSTSVFMQAVYRAVQEEGLSFAEAHTAVKRGFTRGDYLDAWRAPYYWAPYVYYGP